MFRNRTNSQKPPDNLLADFRNAYPGLSTTEARSASLSNAAIAEPVVNEDLHQAATSLTDALDVAVPHHRLHASGEHDIKDMDPTPRGNSEQWRFTPSILDSESFAFTTFANQPPGYYTPTPGGTNTIYHPQAGDLHTPGFALGLGTPLSMPNSDSSGHMSQTAGQMFNPQALAPAVFHNPNPFDFGEQSHAQSLSLQHAPTFAPPQFQNHQGYDSFHHLAHDKIQDFSTDVAMQGQQSSRSDTFLHMPMDSLVTDASRTTAPRDPITGSFRYQTTLNAPTAMVKNTGEIPVTYLNKGQAYSIKMIDTRPTAYTTALPTYRTFLRVSFEDEQQRQRPAQCWQLWKEGRGSSEAHHRGGRLQAVEFVDANSGNTLDPAMRPRIELESASFDGFSIRWTPSPHGPPECQVSVRFNFLSTDFSHSKGVKGIPVRLCAKTQLLSQDSSATSLAVEPEICYCKVKLFRDHGAERKLSNDVAHVKKSIDKLQQQINQLETGMKDFGKRKKSDATGKVIGPPAARPGKVPKHKRTWSMSSTSDADKKASLAEDELHSKLAVLQDMFSSTKPASLLFLRGEESDDPDLTPVTLSAEPMQGLKRVATGDSANWEGNSNQASDIVSPTPSHHTLASQDRGEHGGVGQGAAYTTRSTAEWLPQTATADLHSSPLQPTHLETPVKIPTNRQDNALASWIEALGVDQTYQAPPERVIKPVASLFVQPRISGQVADDDYYRAVYLMQRTINDLKHGVANKSGIEPSKILRVLRINHNGIAILMDDESVTEMPEAQDMIAEFSAISASSPIKREWDSGPADIQVDGDIDVIQTVQSEGYELRLVY